MTEVLDISETVTREQYDRMLRSLLDQFEQWRKERGWCTDLYHYVGQLSRTFKWNPEARGVYGGYDGEMTISVPDDRTGEEMAADLRDIRGRVLRFTIDMSSHINLRMANEFLTRAGLAPYTAAGVVSIETSCRVTTALTETEIREKVTEFLATLGENARRVDVYVSPVGVSSVPEAETTELLEYR
jgi:hypothetical protein